MIRTKPTRNEPRYAVIISMTLGLGVFALVTLLRAAGLWQPSELLAYDLFLALRPTPHDASRYVTMIEVTEADIAALGHWPVSDVELAEALADLGALEPRAIGLDIYRDVEVPPGRVELDAVLSNDERIVAVTKLADARGRGVPAPPALLGSDRVGFNDVLVDSDGIVRRGLLFMDHGPHTATAFALLLATKYLAAEGVALVGDPIDPDHVRLGQTTVRPLSADVGAYVGVDAGGYQFLIDYAQPQFDTFTFGELRAGRVPQDAIRGRIVLLGVAADSVKDDFYAPLGRWVRQGDAKMSGIELHARIVDQLLRVALQAQPPMSSFGTTPEQLWILLWALTGAGAGLMGRSARRLALLWVFGAVAIAAATYAMFRAHWWTPVIPAWLAWLGASGLVTAYLAQAERRQRQVLHDLFATHVSEDVANMLWDRRAELVEHGSLKPQGLTATTLFLDLRGFTSISERLAPDDLMRWLNRALEAFARTILEHDGMIDDYFGDGIKANFGVFARPGAEDAGASARQAVECARALARATLDLNARLRQGDSPYAIRIGIHTGFVIAGTVGSERRSKFTTIGDAVNLAARLEALEDPRLDAASTCQIIVSETTRGHLGPEVATRAVAAVRLKGKRAPVTVHQVLLEDLADTQVEAMEALQP